MAAKKKPKAKNTTKTKKKTSAPKAARKAVARKPAPKKVAPKKSAKAKPTAAPKTAPAPTPAPVARTSVTPPPVAPRPVTPPPVAPTPVAPPPGERIGTVTHYYSHLSVAIIELDTGSLRVGDMIHIKGHTSDFQQRVDSMEIDRVNVNEAGPGKSLGLRVKQPAREHDIVYKVTR